jgi:hypothetical protein
MSLVPIAYFHFIFWGTDFHVLKPDFHHLRTPTVDEPYAGLATIFPSSSFSTYAQGVFASCVKTVNHFSGIACA